MGQSDDRLLPWFALKSIPGVGNHLFKRLLDRFQSPAQVFAASYQDLVPVKGISARIAAAILAQQVPAAIRQELETLQRKNYRVITMTDPEYPPLLLQIPDPPPFFYCCGTLPDTAAAIAVVGSRNATRYGLFTAKKLCEALAERGLTVVSGMARGIDTAAHQGALNANGKTIAVLGSGLERIYPWENRPLYQQIIQQGAVISEFNPTAGPAPQNFPIRNRIISGLCLGTVVVEAARKSGSLITARLAAEQGREVFAIPGSIHTHHSAGAHSLIKQGARLVETVDDIFEELKYMIETKPLAKNAPAELSGQRPAAENLPADERLIYQALTIEPVHVDEIIRSTGFDPGKVSGLLLNLELMGLAQQYPGKSFSLA